MPRPLRRKVRCFAAWHPEIGVNNYWVRAQAKDIRNSEGWEAAKSRGHKIVPVMVTLIGRRPRAAKDGA